ncbi:MAG: TonB-dependent receptor, partial [Flammeovirgaceae bacterium]|nr:TonB-dependent receptor [Flammeovirgaceae bacterium]
MKTFLKGVLVFLCFEKTLAQNPDSLSKTPLALSLEEVMKLPVKAQTDIEVVSASKIKQRLEDAPNIIDVAFKKQIHKYGWIGAQEVLNSQPGFFFSQDYDRRTIGFRGMFEGWNNNHLLTLIDGIPFNDNLYGTAYTTEITPLVFVKNMEIIRGAGGALYGTNAMNGVISLTTPFKDEIGKTGELRIRTGNKGYRIYDLLAGAETKELGIVTAFHHFTTEGIKHHSYDRSGRKDVNGNRAKFALNDQRRNYYFFTKVYGKDKWDGLSVQYHLQTWEFGTGHGWLFMIPDQPEKMK